MPVKPHKKISAVHPPSMSWKELTHAYSRDIKTLKSWINKNDSAFLEKIGRRRVFSPAEVKEIFRRCDPPEIAEFS